MNNAPSRASSLPTLLAVYGVLLLLLALTVVAARLPPGPWNLPVALAIAFAKTGLIFYYFMRLRQSTGLIRFFAVAGFLWLGILLGLTFIDYGTRGWLM